MSMEVSAYLPNKKRLIMEENKRNAVNGAEILKKNAHEKAILVKYDTIFPCFFFCGVIKNQLPHIFYKKIRSHDEYFW